MPTNSSNSSLSSVTSTTSRRINGPLITNGPVPPRLRNSPYLSQTTSSSSAAPIPIFPPSFSTPSDAWFDHAEYSAPPPTTTGSTTISTSPSAATLRPNAKLRSTSHAHVLPGQSSLNAKTIASASISLGGPTLHLASSPTERILAGAGMVPGLVLSRASAVFSSDDEDDEEDILSLVRQRGGSVAASIAVTSRRR